MDAFKVKHVTLEVSDDAQATYEVFATWIESVNDAAIMQSGEGLDERAKCNMQYGWMNGMIHATRMINMGLITAAGLNAVLEEIGDALTRKLKAGGA